MPVKPKTASYKYQVISLLFASLLIVGYLSQVLSITPLEQTQNDYSYQYSKYLEVHDSLAKTKDAYQTFKTAVAKNDTFLASKNYLDQVNNVFLAYVAYLKESGNSFDWQQQNPQKDKIFAVLADEENFFKSQKADLAKLQKLEDIPAFSASLNQQSDSELSPKTYFIFATYEIVKTKATLADFQKLAEDTRSYVLKNFSKDKADVFIQNWDPEIEKITKNSANSIDLADGTKNSAVGNKLAKEQLQQVLSFTNNAKEVLKKAKVFFDEATKST